MTPAEIETASRRKYNSASSSFFSSAEIYDLIYQAELEIAQKTRMLEGLSTALTTTSGTRNYSMTSVMSELKRVEYNGSKLKKIDMREDDSLTLSNSDSTATGTPQYYSEWNRTIYLRPTPDTSSVVLRVYYYALPAPITSASQVLEVPALFHMCIVDYVAAEMASKDENHKTASVYFDKWYNKHLPEMEAWVAKKKRGDSFKVVKDELDTIGTYLGGV